MIRRPPRSTQSRSSAASDVYKRQLLGLIVRGVAFEYRGKHPGWTWRNRWDWAAAIGSLLPPLVFGVGFANFLIGLPLKNVAILGGATTVPLFDGDKLWA